MNRQSEEFTLAHTGISWHNGSNQQSLQPTWLCKQLRYNHKYNTRVIKKSVLVSWNYKHRQSKKLPAHFGDFPMPDSPVPMTNNHVKYQILCTPVHLGSIHYYDGVYTIHYIPITRVLQQTRRWLYYQNLIRPPATNCINFTCTILPNSSFDNTSVCLLYCYTLSMLGNNNLMH